MHLVDGTKSQKIIGFSHSVGRGAEDSNVLVIVTDKQVYRVIGDNMVSNLTSLQEGEYQLPLQKIVNGRGVKNVEKLSRDEYNIMYNQYVNNVLFTWEDTKKMIGDLCVLRVKLNFFGNNAVLNLLVPTSFINNRQTPTKLVIFKCILDQINFTSSERDYLFENHITHRFVQGFSKREFNTLYKLAEPTKQQLKKVFGFETSQAISQMQAVITQHVEAHLNNRR